MNSEELEQMQSRVDRANEIVLAIKETREFYAYINGLPPSRKTYTLRVLSHTALPCVDMQIPTNMLSLLLDLATKRKLELEKELEEL